MLRRSHWSSKENRFYHFDSASIHRGNIPLVGDGCESVIKPQIALHWATRRNHQETIENFLRAGFDPKSPAKDGKTPLDLITEGSVKEIFKQSVNIEANQDIYAAQFNYEMNFNEKLDSLHHIHFLVRTSHEKEVLEVVTDISDKMKIKTQEQIRNLTNHQKVEVVFIRLVFEGILFNIGEVVYGEIIAFLKGKTTPSKLASKFANVSGECLESCSYGRSVDDITALSDSSDVDDSVNRMKDPGGVCSNVIHEERMMSAKVSEVASECLLTAQSSTAEITSTSEVAENTVKSQVANSQQYNAEIGWDNCQILHKFFGLKPKLVIK